MKREDIEGLILEAARKGDLNRLQKNRIERVMTSRFRAPARERMVDRVTQELLDEGALVVTPEGAEAAVDIGQIISIIERLLPILLQILSLFGV